MGLESRPFIGSWKLNGQQLVAHTPDCLVYLNGATALPGCSKCSGKIDIQKFITEVSVDAGTEAGSHSATFSLSIPLHHTESFARDAKFLLRPGLEVHIYMRGYFPVKGLYSHLAEQQAQAQMQGGVQAVVAGGGQPANGDLEVSGVKSSVAPPALAAAYQRMKLNADQIANADIAYSEFLAAGYTPSFASAGVLQAYAESHLQNIKQRGGPGLGMFQLDPGGLGGSNPNFEGGKAAGVADTPTTWNALDPLRNAQRETLAAQEIANAPGGGKIRVTSRNSNSTVGEAFMAIYGSPMGLGVRSPRVYPRKNGTTRYTPEEWHAKWDQGAEKRAKMGQWFFRSDWTDEGYNARAKQSGQEITPPSSAVVSGEGGFENLIGTGDVPSSPDQVQADPSILDQLNLPPGLANTLAYPYYHVFHGVVTSVNHSYSGGVNSVSVTCNSMLHFWQYHQMSTQASYFGARPTNSKLKMSLVGNNYTGMHPYAIIYSLHNDTGGAAHGVSWALSDKTNQDAVAESGQESLFSLNIRYWERRFSRSTRLRMHGATGELFSTMAAAWLSRMSSGKIMKVVRSRYNNSQAPDTMNVLAQSNVVGLGRQRLRKATEYAGMAAGGVGGSNSANFGINVLEMQAFVSNIGEWGQVNLFESTYQSKLDIANMVCQVTGFEFFQDVDGDFVFKPPMWNLDTSSSRVYRIEDIDIISISFTENEPQVTYVTCKGSQFKNLLGHGMENEWGVRGQYIDYRLVAQYGWRPGDFETHYFNDPKSMFFAAVNRLDMLNIAVSAANVTIPVRPELRPGYPVFIPYLDCYYYCNSFSHSHSVGGQCTTSLTLVGKRAKFFAPGDTVNGRQGIDAINLGNTVLPERPLQVLGKDGKPRLSGFPNTVMALDPTGINPMFFVVGTDVENLADAQVVKNLLEYGASSGVLKKTPQSDGSVYYTMKNTFKDPNNAAGYGTDVTFFMDEAGPVPDSAGTSDRINVMAAIRQYSNLQTASLGQGDSNRAQMVALQTKVKELYAEYNDLSNGAAIQSSDLQEKKSAQARLAELDKAMAAADDALQTAKEALAQADHALEATWRDPSQHLGPAFLLSMVDQVGAAYRTSDQFQGRGDLSSTISLLDMLSDKKAVFTNGQQPGYYRYYSASHPDPDQQGPRRVAYENRRLVTAAPEDCRAGTAPVQQYAGFPALSLSGAIVPEASLADDIQPEKGIRVLTANPNEPKGEVLATSEIMEVMFSVQDVTVTKTSTSNRTVSKMTGAGRGVEGKVREALTLANAGGKQSGDSSLQQLYGSVYNNLQAKTSAAIFAMSAKILVRLHGLMAPGWPSSVVVGTGRMTLSDPIQKYKYQDSRPGEISLGKDTATFADIANAGGMALGTYFAQQVAIIRASAVKQMKAGNVPQTDQDTALSAFNATFSVGAVTKPTTKEVVKVETSKPETTFSPVFPVSDAQGYHVIGSYRYGRGVDIDPSGVFDQLHKADLFRFVDKNTMDQILQVFVLNKGITVTVSETIDLPDGKKKIVPVSKALKGEGARKYVNDDVLRQLRTQLTDQQILDYTAAFQKSRPGQLDFNLANYIMDQNTDGVVKVPVVNAAYSLADLNLQQAGHVCDCKAAEASVLISAFGSEEFVSFTQRSDVGEATDAATRWVAIQAALAATTWEQQQQALRGQVLDRGGSPLVPALQAAGLVGGGPGIMEQAKAASARVKDRMDALKKKL